LPVLDVDTKRLILVPRPNRSVSTSDTFWRIERFSWKMVLQSSETDTDCAYISCSLIHANRSSMINHEELMTNIIESANLVNVDWSSLPPPEDDGAASHLTGSKVPSVLLMATNGQRVDLAKTDGLVIVYAYPMTGKPGSTLPVDWDFIPGARGCTPQSCSFRDHFADLRRAGAAKVFGLSTQTTEEQLETAERLHLPFPLLSDSAFELSSILRFPTFIVEGRTFLKRFTMIIEEAVVRHVFYPVFPPDQNAADVVKYLETM
jgi:peroxiredoxin